MDGLVVALEAEGRWPELISALERRASTATNVDDARRDRLTIARLLADAGDVDAALAALRSLAEELGTNDAVVDTEASLLETAGRREELLLLLDGEAIRAPEVPRRVRLHLRAADVRRAASISPVSTRWSRATRDARRSTRSSLTIEVEGMPRASSR
jgi:hypothetical protein